MNQLISECDGELNRKTMAENHYSPGWKFYNESLNQIYSQSIRTSFLYQIKSNSFETNTNGYIYEFRGSLKRIKENLEILRNLSWIDFRTRLIIIELTVYNVNTQLFSLIRFHINIPSTGGLILQSKIEPVDLHNQFADFSSIIHIICASIYLLIIIYSTYQQIYSIYKLKGKYFSKSIWIYIQWGIIICSYFGLTIYVWRFKEGSQLNQYLHQTNGYEFINIESFINLNEILLDLFGFCCFFCTIKYLYLFRFNSRLNQFGKTLEYVRKDLFYFAFTFILMFISFLSLFYLLFHSTIFACKDLLHTAQILFEMLLFKFDSHDLYEADRFLGPLSFTLFIYPGERPTAVSDRSR